MSDCQLKSPTRNSWRSGRTPEVELDAVGIVAVMPTESIRSHSEHAVNEAGDPCREQITVQEAIQVIGRFTNTMIARLREGGNCRFS
jgi:hypothetical protein